MEFVEGKRQEEETDILELARELRRATQEGLAKHTDNKEYKRVASQTLRAVDKLEAAEVKLRKSRLRLARYLG